MPRFTHFNIWDKDLKAFIEEIKSNVILRSLSKDIEDWFYWDGCCIYIENELKTLHNEALACIKQHGRFTDMSGPAMTGHVFWALDAMATPFYEYFKVEENEEANQFLKASYDKFMLAAIRNHKHFYECRAEVAAKLDPRMLPPAPAKSDGNEVVLKSITIFLFQGLECIKEKLRASSSDFSSALISDLIEDIDNFISYRQEYEKFENKSNSMPRITRSPNLSSRSVSTTSVRNERIVPNTLTPSAPAAPLAPGKNKKVAQRLMQTLASLRMFDKRSESKSEEPIKADYVVRLSPPS